MTFQVIHMQLHPQEKVESKHHAQQKNLIGTRTFSLRKNGGYSILGNRFVLVVRQDGNENLVNIVMIYLYVYVCEKDFCKYHHPVLQYYLTHKFYNQFLWNVVCLMKQV